MPKSSHGSKPAHKAPEKGAAASNPKGGSAQIVSKHIDVEASLVTLNSASTGTPSSVPSPSRNFSIKY